jgi:hypothetical protein
MNVSSGLSDAIVVVVVVVVGSCYGDGLLIVSVSALIYTILIGWIVLIHMRDVLNNLI